MDVTSASCVYLIANEQVGVSENSGHWQMKLKHSTQKLTENKLSLLFSSSKHCLLSVPSSYTIFNLTASLHTPSFWGSWAPPRGWSIFWRGTEASFEAVQMGSVCFCSTLRRELVTLRSTLLFLNIYLLFFVQQSWCFNSFSWHIPVRPNVERIWTQTPVLLAELAPVLNGLPTRNKTFTLTFCFDAPLIKQPF